MFVERMAPAKVIKTEIRKRPPLSREQNNERTFGETGNLVHLGRRCRRLKAPEIVLCLASWLTLRFNNLLSIQCAGISTANIQSRQWEQRPERCPYVISGNKVRSLKHSRMRAIGMRPSADQFFVVRNVSSDQGLSLELFCPGSRFTSPPLT